MEIDTKEQLILDCVPKLCPFCYASGFEWNEFIVHFAELQYVDEKGLHLKIVDEIAKVFCTRCKEEVRAEDIYFDNRRKVL